MSIEEKLPPFLKPLYPYKFTILYGVVFMFLGQLTLGIPALLGGMFVDWVMNRAAVRRQEGKLGFTWRYYLAFVLFAVFVYASLINHNISFDTVNGLIYHWVAETQPFVDKVAEYIPAINNYTTAMIDSGEDWAAPKLGHLLAVFFFMNFLIIPLLLGVISDSFQKDRYSSYLLKMQRVFFRGLKQQEKIYSRLDLRRLYGTIFIMLFATTVLSGLLIHTFVFSSKEVIWKAARHAIRGAHQLRGIREALEFPLQFEGPNNSFYLAGEILWPFIFLMILLAFFSCAFLLYRLGTDQELKLLATQGSAKIDIDNRHQMDKKAYASFKHRLLVNIADVFFLSLPPLLLSVLCVAIALNDYDLTKTKIIFYILLTLVITIRCWLFPVSFPGRPIYSAKIISNDGRDLGLLQALAFSALGNIWILFLDLGVPVSLLAIGVSIFLRLPLFFNNEKTLLDVICKTYMIYTPKGELNA